MFKQSMLMSILEKQWQLKSQIEVKTSWSTFSNLVLMRVNRRGKLTIRPQEDEKWLSVPAEYEEHTEGWEVVEEVWWVAFRGSRVVDRI